MHGKTLDDCKNYIAHYGNDPSKTKWATLLDRPMQRV
jgi:hypothetical protein